MPDIENSVGESGGIKGANLDHDVALVQAMLKVIKNAKGAAYLHGHCDGVYGGDTRQAIIAFQTEHKLIAAPAASPATGGRGALPPQGLGTILPFDEPGLVTRRCLTIGKLNSELALLPDPHPRMRVIDGMRIVYIGGDAHDMMTSRVKIVTDAQLDTNFRFRVGELVKLMFERHGIVLWLTKDGSRRTFAEQANPQLVTDAGPGESNHNWGRAVDIGFKNFRWLKGDGTIATDQVGDLETLRTSKQAQWDLFWDARDAIAINQLHLFRISWERIHLATFHEVQGSVPISFTALLNEVGALKWGTLVAGGTRRYKSNLGFGATMHDVGTAKVIWAGAATVTKAMAAEALSIKTGKTVAANDVKDSDIESFRAALKKDFETAEANWRKWIAP